MTASLRALLAGVIDYAGLFPPAALPLDAAIGKYARYLKSDDRWMLARFICPTTRLPELLPYLNQLFGDEPGVSIAALGRGGKDGWDLVANLESDLQEVSRFRSVAGPKAVVDVLEMRLPADALSSGEILDQVAGRAADHNLRVFLEVPMTPGLDQSVASVAGNLAARQAGFKLRTGGTEPAAFPPSQTIARTLVACRDARCALKFTAGLHHPIRQYHDSVGTRMHGFLNVLVAAVLACTHNMDLHGVTEVLECESAADFAFDEHALRWKTLCASRHRIEQVREQVVSFGSCSFDEPREDLRSLGWL
ncbi:MAG: hypothetical protein NZ561_00850 [Phycisphaerae bacterium]|nr:hypothetical protein [Phycisphaerae bacterium]MDW8262644.1 hypothetical protein [Phycisphaerales bacterium]